MARLPAAPQRRNGPYAPLSAHYPHDDAILVLDAAEDDLAELLFVRSLAYCAADPRLDGFISDAALSAGVVLRRRNQQRVIKKAERLVELGVYVREPSGYRIRSWPKWNRTYAEIEGKRETDRLRKSSAQPPNDEPPPPEDSEWSPDGFQTDSARNPDGALAESLGVASRARAGASNATHSSTTHDNASHGSSSAVPSPLPFAELETALARANIAVAWDPDPEGLAVIAAAIDRCGIPALLKQAQSRYRTDAPAFSVRAFIPGWNALPAKPAKLELVPDPCEHGFGNRRRCAHCRMEAAS